MASPWGKRSGGSWLAEMLWLVMAQVRNNNNCCKLGAVTPRRGRCRWGRLRPGFCLGGLEASLDRPPRPVAVAFAAGLQVPMFNR
jgi:hypothetical protein